MADIKMILAQDRARVEFAERAAKWFDEHPEHWSYSDGDPKPGQMFALRWAAKPGKPTISVLVFDLPYDAVIVGDLDQKNPLSWFNSIPNAPTGTVEASSYMAEQRAKDRKLGEAIAASYVDRPPHGHRAARPLTQWSEFEQNGERFVRCIKCMEFTTFLRSKAIIADHERICDNSRCPGTVGGGGCDLKSGHDGPHIRSAR